MSYDADSLFESLAHTESLISSLLRKLNSFEEFSEASDTELAGVDKQSFIDLHCATVGSLCDLEWTICQIRQELLHCSDFLRGGGLVDFPVTAPSRIEAATDYVASTLNSAASLYRKYGIICDETAAPPAIYSGDYIGGLTAEGRKDYVRSFKESFKQTMLARCRDAAEKCAANDGTRTQWLDDYLQWRWWLQWRQTSEFVRKLDALCKIEISQVRNRLRMGQTFEFDRDDENDIRDNSISNDAAFDKFRQHMNDLAVSDPRIIEKLGYVDRVRRGIIDTDKIPDSTQNNNTTLPIDDSIEPWHAGTADPPVDYAYGPLTGQQKELCAWIIPGAKSNKPLITRLRHQVLWGRIDGRTQFSIWFQSETQFKQAQDRQQKDHTNPAVTSPRRNGREVSRDNHAC